MPILLDADGYTNADLLFSIKGSPNTEVFEHLARAAQAKATLRDPLAFMLDDTTKLESDICLGQELPWLLINASLNYDTPSTRTVLPITGWLANVNCLADKLIRKNYLQGWQRSHPAFWLKFTPVHHKNDGTQLETRPMYSEHWALFVQSVMIKHWLGTISGINVMPMIESLCRATLAGATTTLTSEYVCLARKDGERFYHIRTATSVIETWRENIKVAALHYGDWLKRQITH